MRMIYREKEKQKGREYENDIQREREKRESDSEKGKQYVRSSNSQTQILRQIKEKFNNAVTENLNQSPSLEKCLLCALEMKKIVI